MIDLKRISNLRIESSFNGYYVIAIFLPLIEDEIYCLISYYSNPAEFIDCSLSVESINGLDKIKFNIEYSNLNLMELKSSHKEVCEYLEKYIDVIFLS